MPRLKSMKLTGSSSRCHVTCTCTCRTQTLVMQRPSALAPLRLKLRQPSPTASVPRQLKIRSATPGFWPRISGITYLPDKVAQVDDRRISKGAPSRASVIGRLRAPSRSRLRFANPGSCFPAGRWLYRVGLRWLEYFFGAILTGSPVHPVAWCSGALAPFLRRVLSALSCFRAGGLDLPRCDRCPSGGFPCLPPVWLLQPSAP